MSTQEPIGTHDRIVARSQGGASPTMQWSVLLLAAVAAGVMGWILAGVDAQDNPMWVLVVIGCGVVCFGALLVAGAWSMRAAVAGAPAPRVGGGVLLVALLTAAAGAAFVRSLEMSVPQWRWLTPAVLALVFAVLVLLGGVRRRAGIATRDRLRGGRQVQATITDDGLAAFEASPNPKVATVTVLFHDNDGTQRWVRTGALQVPGRPLAVGDEVTLWFDPARPGDVSQIVIEADNGSSRVIAGTVQA